MLLCLRTFPSLKNNILTLSGRQQRSGPHDSNLRKSNFHTAIQVYRISQSFNLQKTRHALLDKKCFRKDFFVFWRFYAAEREKKESSGTKRLVRILSVYLPAGMATTGQPLGPMLGQFQISTPNFVKQFNEKTGELIKGMPPNTEVLVKCFINVYDDRTFTFTIDKPPTSFLLKQKIKVDEYGRRYITRRDLVEIAKFKFGDSLPLEKSVPQIWGTAKSMGLRLNAAQRVLWVSKVEEEQRLKQSQKKVEETKPKEPAESEAEVKVKEETESSKKGDKQKRN
jgi:ribosomal protein L11